MQVTLWSMQQDRCTLPTVLMDFVCFSSFPAEVGELGHTYTRVKMERLAHRTHWQLHCWRHRPRNLPWPMEISAMQLSHCSALSNPLGEIN